MLAISDRFDAGNIEVLSAADPQDVKLAIRGDVGGEHYQWFHFRISGARDTPLRLRITNASSASYEGGWPGYRACASSDGESWFRVETRYENGELLIEHTPDSDVVWYAYFAPYSFERHTRLLGWAQAQEGVRLEELGQTLDGRSLDMLRIGTPVHEDPRKALWIIARQHPGESMAQWLVEGLLERLLDPAEPLACMLRQKAVFYVVPNMNPDGSVRGHLRTNAAGANLNREWATPTMERSPEVALVKGRMQKLGLRFCLDVHGDEALPYNFIAGPDGVGDLPASVLSLRDRYCAGLVRACPDFQTEHGYPRCAPGKANMTMATNQLAQLFGALAMTLEMPFKDNANAPNEETGWSPARCKALGRAQLDAIADVVDEL
jgi:murein tripeptide amidase MpaA